jgi:fibronectin type 3 domain-containing protein
VFDLFRENITGNMIRYPVPDAAAGEYKFFVIAVKKSGVESAPSDTLTVQTITTELPVPVISKTLPDTNKITVQWQYPEITDLKGFMLYMNGAAVASPKELKKNTREYTVPKITAGTTYEFRLRALTVAGLVSDYSPAVQVAAPAE